MSKRQLAMVMDLNKCIGCQTCTVACKTQWTNRNGREYMYWNNVETYPGTGYPKNWMELGGGFDAAGDLQPGVIPNLEADYGVPWDYNYESLMGGLADSNHFHPHVSPTWGPNWDEDQGAGAFPQGRRGGGPDQRRVGDPAGDVRRRRAGQLREGPRTREAGRRGRGHRRQGGAQDGLFQGDPDRHGQGLLAADRHLREHLRLLQAARDEDLSRRAAALLLREVEVGR